MTREPALITAEGVFDGERLIAPGALLCSEGRVVAVGQEALDAVPADAHRDDLPGCLLAPRFVNAHSHLALAYLRGRLAFPGSFTAWLARLVQVLDARPEEYRASVRAGAEECAASGTGLVADVLFFTAGIPAHLETPLETVVLLEFAGLEGPAVEGALASVRTALDRFGDRLSFGIAPHAPYSTGAEAYQRGAELARERGLPISTHLSESPEELELLAHGTGGFAPFVRGRWTSDPDAWRAPRCSPTRWLADLGVLGPDLLAVHVNYLSDEDITLLAESGTTAVYCPRSHRYFEHPPHPLPRLLDAGVPVAVGTDSVASNDSLEMHEELKLVHERFPELPPETVWRLGTQAGAAALRRAGDHGALRPGALAGCIAVKPAEGEGDLLARSLLPAASIGRVW